MIQMIHKKQMIQMIYKKQMIQIIHKKQVIQMIHIKQMIQVIYKKQMIHKKQIMQFIKELLFTFSHYLFSQNVSHFIHIGCVFTEMKYTKRSAIAPNLVPRLFLRGRKDPGRSWSLGSQKINCLRGCGKSIILHASTSALNTSIARGDNTYARQNTC